MRRTRGSGRWGLTVALWGAAVIAGGDLWAQGLWAGAGPPDTGTATEQEMALSPSQLVATLHQLNQMVITAGQMAQKKGSGRAIKEYGHDLVLDHHAADDDITAYASGKGIDLNDLPAEAEVQVPRFRVEMDKLQKISGPSFDHRFAQDVANAYEKVIPMIDASRPGISDEVLVVLLDTLEPKLRKHHLMAEDIVNEKRRSATNLDSRRSSGAGTP